jgi:flagellar hook-associated protein 1 FlgK
MPGSPYTAAQLAAGVQVDGLSLQLASGSAIAGDRFLLQPVAEAALNMQTVLSDPNALAAASPVTASLGAANTGSAGIVSARAVDAAALDRTLTASISFTSDTGNYDWELRDAGGSLVSSGSAVWSAGQPIGLNGFELMLDGTPRTGDTMQVAPTTAVAGSNGNALAFSELAEVGFVDARTLPDGTVVPGKTITDAYASAVAEVGVRVQSATTAAGISEAAAADAETTRANKAGVNLDEEAARLIQYQQSYQAAAKMLQVAQQVFDTLLQQMG